MLMRTASVFWFDEPKPTVSPPGNSALLKPCFAAAAAAAATATAAAACLDESARSLLSSRHVWEKEIDTRMWMGSRPRRTKKGRSPTQTCSHNVDPTACCAPLSLVASYVGAGREEYLHGNDFEIDVETCFATCFGSVAVIGTVTSIATVVASLLEMANVCHRILLETDFEKA